FVLGKVGRGSGECWEWWRRRKTGEIVVLQVGGKIGVYSSCLNRGGENKGRFGSFTHLVPVVSQDYDISSTTPCLSIHAIYVMYCHYIRSLSVMLSRISFHVLIRQRGVTSKVDISCVLGCEQFLDTSSCGEEEGRYSTNEVNTAYGVSTSSCHNLQKEGSSSYTDDLMYTFFANQSIGTQLDHEDLEQVDEFDLEELHLKWQVAMISTRLKKFYKKTRRKLHFDAKEPVGIDKRKVECFNYHNTGHFARECKSKGNQDSQRKNVGNTIYKAKGNGKRPAKQDEHKAMVTIDGEDTEVTSCLKVSEESYAKLKNLYDEQREQPGVTSIEIQAYTLALKKLESQLVCHQKNQLAYEEKISQMSAKDKSGLGYGSQLHDEVLSYENEVFATVFDSRSSDAEDSPSTTSESNAKTSDLDSCDSSSSKETLETVPKPVANKPKALVLLGANGKLLLRPQHVIIRDTKDITGIESPKYNSGSKSRECVDIKDPLGRLKHMTGNKAYLVDYQDFNGRHVAFKGSNGQITGKGKIRTRKLDFENRFTWVFFSRTKDETSRILKDFIRQIKNQLNQKVKTIKCDNGIEFKNRDIIKFYGSKGIKGEYSNAKTPQQNEVAERNNRTLIEATRTMLANSFLPNTFWAEVVSTACYVLIRVLVNKPQNKTPYELLTENKANKTTGLKKANNSAGTQDTFNAGKSEIEVDHAQEYYVLTLWSSYTSTVKSSKEKNEDEKLNEDTDLKTYEESVDQEDQCDEFEALMKNKFQMSFVGKLTFFLGFKPIEDCIFISHDKYVAEILKKIDFLSVKTVSTPIETKKPLVKNEESVDVDVHLYRSMMDSLIYLTASRYLKGQPKLGLWYPKESAFDVEAYSNNDYIGENLDRKSTIRGCQFLCRRLISWHCKKQTIVATSTIKAEYVATTMLIVVNTAGIHLILLGYNLKNAKTTSWNEFSSTMESAIICLATNQKFIFLRYILLSLVKNEKAGVPFFMFSRFIQLINNHQLGDMAHHKEIFDTPSLTKKVITNIKLVGTGFSREVTPLFDNMLVQAPEEVAEQIFPSPSNDPLPSGKDSLKLKELMDLFTNLSNKVLELESKVIDIKSTYQERIEKLEGREKSSKQGMKIADIDADVEINLEKAQAQAYNLDLDHQENVLSMMDVNQKEPADVEDVGVLRKRRGVIIQDLEETTTTDEEVARQLEADLNADINWNDVIEQVKRNERLNDVVMKYQTLKRKPLTQAQARRNMIVYLKNMAGFKMDYFKGMKYDDIRPLFEKYYNYNKAFLDEVNEGVNVLETEVRQEKDVEVESSKREGENLEQEIAKKQRMEEETGELKKYLQVVTDDDDDDDGEDLESLWIIVRDKFKKTKPKNYSDDYLINTLKIMFGKPNVEASVWKDQKGRYGLEKVKS
nr:ribonuclease H-like domain-containing protein [Tanacetum cinerariifolium]